MTELVQPDATAPSSRFKRFAAIAAGFALLAIIGGVFTYNHFFRRPPAPFFASDEDHFLFGSIGTEETDGIPYWIWLVLPRIFPPDLPPPPRHPPLGSLGDGG